MVHWFACDSLPTTGFKRLQCPPLTIITIIIIITFLLIIIIIISLFIIYLIIWIEYSEQPADWEFILLVPSYFLFSYFRIFVFLYFCIFVFLYFCIFVFSYFCIFVFPSNASTSTYINSLSAQLSFQCIHPLLKSLSLQNSCSCSCSYSCPIIPSSSKITCLI